MKNQKRNLLYHGVSLAIVIVVLAVFLWPRPKEKVDIVFLGDSIIGNVMYPTQGVDVVQEKTGMTVFNGAFGGTCMAYKERDNVMLEPSLWSMAELAKAICYGDFKAQLSSIEHGHHYDDINHNVPEYYTQRMKELSEIDFSQVKILVIEHGTNDYNTSTPLDNEKEPYDRTTFGGALRSSLKLLKEKYPDLRIILMSPIYCELDGNGEGKCYDTDYGSGTLDRYVEKEKEIAEEFGIEFLDAYHGSGIWEENAQLYLFDGIHPTQEGQILLGEFIAEYLLDTSK